jgi:hypothetical protein
MTDPNMRRLLEVSIRKSSDEGNDCKHYAIMKRLIIRSEGDTDGIQKFGLFNESLQEALNKEIGVNVIWVDDYDEIPKLLAEIKGR